MIMKFIITNKRNDDVQVSVIKRNTKYIRRENNYITMRLKKHDFVNKGN